MPSLVRNYALIEKNNSLPHLKERRSLSLKEVARDLALAARAAQLPQFLWIKSGTKPNVESDEPMLPLAGTNCENQSSHTNSINDIT